MVMSVVHTISKGVNRRQSTENSLKEEQFCLVDCFSKEMCGNQRKKLGQNLVINVNGAGVSDLFNKLRGRLAFLA